MKDKILEDLNKTGFINELRVAQKFEEKSWRPKLNDSFFDKDSQISREIDLIVKKRASNVKNKLGLWINLTVEVKKSAKPWIVFTNDLEKKGGLFNGMPGWTLIHGGENYIGENGPIFTPRDIHEKIMRINKTRIGTAFHESFKPPTETSKIFQAIISACKAAVDKSEIHPRENSFMKDFRESDEIYLEFYHPLVVVDGPLFEVYLDKANEIQLEEQKWIPVNYEYSSKQYSESFGHSISFYPDIVKFDYIEEYINLLDTWLSSMAVNFDKKIDLHRDK